MRLWAIIIKNHKMARQVIVPLTGVSAQDVREALEAACKQLDLSVPMLLIKHEHELENYGRTAFLPVDFIDSVSFERFEIELLPDGDAPKRRSKDPRNDFS